MRIRSSLLRVLGVLAALGAGACDRSSDVLAPSPSLHAADADSTPFYYYQGGPVYLVEDPTRLVVSSSLPASAADAAAAEVLGALGVRVQSSEALPQARGHRLLHLAPGDRGALASAVARLRNDHRFGFASVAHRTREGNDDVVLVGQVVVRFRSGVRRSQVDSLVGALGARILRAPRPDSGFAEYRIAYPTGADPLRVAAQLDRHPLVEWADPDKISNRRPASVPSDPYYGLQYYLQNPNTKFGVRVDDNVEPAWDLTKGGGVPSAGGITVAVIGDGVEAGHPDLGGQVEFGYDVVMYNNSDLGCDDCAYNPYGSDQHETAVAGIIGGQHDWQGMAGIAPEAWIVPVRILRNTFQNPYPQAATDAGIADGINFAWNLMGADVLSNSWGGGAPSNAITNAINAATTSGRGGRGALVVFAAGNTSNRDGNYIGGVLYPATLSSVVTVSAINSSGNLTNYSPEGSAIDIVAPSGHYTGFCTGDVLSLDPQGGNGCNDGPNGDANYSSHFSGTSAAAPQVSAVGALLYAREPALTLSQVKTRLYNGADSWGTATQYGAGKLNAYHTLVARTTVSISGPGLVSTPGDYTWTANPSGGVGGYTYQWSMSWDGSNYWDTGVTSQSFSEYVGEGDVFWLRVRVTSGPDVAYASRKVTGPGGSCVQSIVPC